MGTPNLYDLAAETASNTKRIAELLESRSSPGWVEVPKSRLAELERAERDLKTDRAHGNEIHELICRTDEFKTVRAGMTHVEGMLAAIREQRARIAALEMVEKDFAAMREDRDAFQAKVAALESEAVDASRLAEEVLKSWREGITGRALIAECRERLAARASAKVEATTITPSDFAGFNRGFEANARADMEALKLAPDDGDFKSAEEDAELVAMGRQICVEWERANGLPPMPAGMLWNSTCHPYLILLIEDDNLPCLRCRDGEALPNRHRALLRRVRRERAERPADADAPK